VPRSLPIRLSVHFTVTEYFSNVSQNYAHIFNPLSAQTASYNFQKIRKTYSFKINHGNVFAVLIRLHRGGVGLSHGATENARPDIVRPSKLWRLTSRDWTKRHHIARVDIARPDKTAPHRKGGHRETWFIVRVEAHYKLIFAAWSII